MKKLLILVIALAMPSMVNALVFSDSFDYLMDAGWGNRADYQAWYMNNVLHKDYPGMDAGASLAGWDGYMALPNSDTDVSDTIAAANYVPTGIQGDGEDPANQFWRPGMDPAGPHANGVLRIITKGGGWEGTLNTGAFLYKNVTGDFVAKVQVVGGDNMFHNMGMVMARDQIDNPDNDGSMEQWVASCFFPLWNNGNRAEDEAGYWGITGYPPQPYLKLSRAGSLFTMESSADGITWNILGTKNKPGMSDTLQVGISHSKYEDGAWSTTMEFDNFSITPEPATICLLGLGALALIRKKS